MKAMGTAFAVVLAFASSAFADGYNDFAQALTANVRDDAQAAIAGFTAALKSGQLDTAQTATAYRGRALAELALRQCDAAEADYKKFTADRNPRHEEVLLHAHIRACLGDGAGAKAEWQVFAGEKPGVYDYWAFSHLLWRDGIFSDAHDAMLQSVSKMEQYQFSGVSLVLWYALTAERVGKPDQAKLTQLVDQLDTSSWPMKVIDFYRGKASREKVFDYAESWSSDTEAYRMCQANFYLGEWYLIHGDVANGRSLLTAAVARCPKGRLELGDAEDELKRLDGANTLNSKGGAL